MNRMRRFATSSVAALAIAAGVVSVPTAAHAASGSAIETLNVRASASTSAKIVGSIRKGARVNFDCYVNGQAIQGPYGRSSMWLRVDGNSGKWVSEAWVYTGTNNATVKKCGTSTPKPVATNKTTQFVNNTRGKSVANASGTYRGECVSLVSQYLLQVHGIRSGAWGNAKDYHGGNVHMKRAGFTWRTDRNYKSGDILVWTTGGGGYGHVGIWHDGKFYDQNNSSRANARTANYSPMLRTAPAGYWRK